LKKKIYSFLDNQFENYRQKGFLLCLSGGVDSSTMLKLLVDRYGAENVIGFTTVVDGFNNIEDINDAKWLCSSLGVKHIVKNISSLCKSFIMELAPELCGLSLNNIASRVRVGMACEFAVKYNRRMVFAAPYTEWIFSGVPIGCDSAHCYPFAGLYKAEILGLAKEIGLDSRFLLKRPSNSAVGSGRIDKTVMYKGYSLSSVDKIAAHLNGLIPLEAVDVFEDDLMHFHVLLKLFGPDIDIRGLDNYYELDSDLRLEFIKNIGKFEFED